MVFDMFGWQEQEERAGVFIELKRETQILKMKKNIGDGWLDNR